MLNSLDLFNNIGVILWMLCIVKSFSFLLCIYVFSQPVGRVNCLHIHISSIKVIFWHMMELISNGIFILFFQSSLTILFSRWHVVSQDFSGPQNHLVNQIVFISLMVFFFSFFKISLHSNSFNTFKVVILNGTWTLSISLLPVFLVWRTTSSRDVTSLSINCLNLLRRSSLISLLIVLLMRNSTLSIQGVIIFLALALIIHL